MRSRFLAAILWLAMAGALESAQPPAPDVIPASGGDITVVPIAHGSVYISHGPHAILIDPARFGPGLPPPPPPSPELIARLKLMPMKMPDGEPNPETTVSAFPVTAGQMARFRGLAPPTLILVTDIHDDHLDPRVIAELKGPATRLIVPSAGASRLLGVQRAEPMANGEVRQVGSATIEAVPMYNPRPDEKFGLVFHTKGRGNGYVVTVGGKRIYVAGDTGCTPEMKNLEKIDVAFLPMNLPYTMAPPEAAECARAFRPKIVYPYHYFESDPQVFVAALKATGIEVRVRDWYTAGAK